MDDLPEFESWPTQRVQTLATDVFMGKLVRLESFDDGHYRAVFQRDYFHLEAGKDTEPSKSQWNSLKKRFKRRQRSVFIFRTYGRCEDEDGKKAEHYYMDFGFLYM